MAQGKILVADDKEINRFLLREMFREKYEVLEAADGTEAIDILKKNADTVIMVLMDIKMPNMHGFEALKIIKSDVRTKHIPVILVTGANYSEFERKGYEMGIADYITKPFDKFVVQKRVENIIDLYCYRHQLEGMVKEQTAKLTEQNRKFKEFNNRFLDVLSNIVEFRNLEADFHIYHIKKLSRAIAESLKETCPEFGLDDERVEMIEQAAAMHDIGKIAIPEAILLKPGKLTEDEYEAIKLHTVRGCDIIKQFEKLQDQVSYQYCYDIVRSHHERFDGKGYPDGLKQDEIPIAAQIVSIADVYDALVNERVYKKAYSKEDAYQMIIHGECGVFPPKILRAFMSCKDQFEKIENKEEDSNH